MLQPAPLIQEPRCATLFEAANALRIEKKTYTRTIESAVAELLNQRFSIESYCKGPDTPPSLDIELGEFLDAFLFRLDRNLQVLCSQLYAPLRSCRHLNFLGRGSAFVDLLAAHRTSVQLQGDLDLQIDLTSLRLHELAQNNQSWKELMEVLRKSVLDALWDASKLSFADAFELDSYLEQACNFPRHTDLVRRGAFAFYRLKSRPFSEQEPSNSPLGIEIWMKVLDPVRCYTANHEGIALVLPSRARYRKGKVARPWIVTDGPSIDHALLLAKSKTLYIEDPNSLDRYGAIRAFKHASRGFQSDPNTRTKVIQAVQDRPKEETAMGLAKLLDAASETPQQLYLALLMGQTHGDIWARYASDIRQRTHGEDADLLHAFYTWIEEAASPLEVAARHSWLAPWLEAASVRMYPDALPWQAWPLFCSAQALYLAGDCGSCPEAITWALAQRTTPAYSTPLAAWIQERVAHLASLPLEDASAAGWHALAVASTPSSDLARSSLALLLSYWWEEVGERPEAIQEQLTWACSLPQCALHTEELEGILCPRERLQATAKQLAAHLPEQVLGHLTWARLLPQKAPHIESTEESSDPRDALHTTVEENALQQPQPKGGREETSLSKVEPPTLPRWYQSWIIPKAGDLEESARPPLSTELARTVFEYRTLQSKAHPSPQCEKRCLRALEEEIVQSAEPQLACCWMLLAGSESSSTLLHALYHLLHHWEQKVHGEHPEEAFEEMCLLTRHTKIRHLLGKALTHAPESWTPHGLWQHCVQLYHAVSWTQPPPLRGLLPPQEWLPAYTTDAPRHELFAQLIQSVSGLQGRTSTVWPLFWLAQHLTLEPSFSAGRPHLPSCVSKENAPSLKAWIQTLASPLLSTQAWRRWLDNLERHAQAVLPQALAEGQAMLLEELGRMREAAGLEQMAVVCARLISLLLIEGLDGRASSSMEPGPTRSVAWAITTLAWHGEVQAAVRHQRAHQSHEAGLAALADAIKLWEDPSLAEVSSIWEEIAARMPSTERGLSCHLAIRHRWMQDHALPSSNAIAAQELLQRRSVLPQWPLAKEELLFFAEQAIALDAHLEELLSLRHHPLLAQDGGRLYLQEQLLMNYPLAEWKLYAEHYLPLLLEHLRSIGTVQPAFAEHCAQMLSHLQPSMGRDAEGQPYDWSPCETEAITLLVSSTRFEKASPTGRSPHLTDLHNDLQGLLTRNVGLCKHACAALAQKKRVYLPFLAVPTLCTTYVAELVHAGFTHIDHLIPILKAEPQTAYVFLFELVRLSPLLERLDPQEEEKVRKQWAKQMQALVLAVEKGSPAACCHATISLKHLVEEAPDLCRTLLQPAHKEHLYNAGALLATTLTSKKERESALRMLFSIEQLGQEEEGFFSPPQPHELPDGFAEDPARGAQVRRMILDLCRYLRSEGPPRLQREHLHCTRMHKEDGAELLIYRTLSSNVEEGGVESSPCPPLLPAITLYLGTSIARWRTSTSLERRHDVLELLQICEDWGDMLSVLCDFLGDTFPPLLQRATEDGVERFVATCEELWSSPRTSEHPKVLRLCQEGIYGLLLSKPLAAGPAATRLWHKLYQIDPQLGMLDPRALCVMSSVWGEKLSSEQKETYRWSSGELHAKVGLLSLRRYFQEVVGRAPPSSTGRYDVRGERIQAEEMIQEESLLDAPLLLMAYGKYYEQLPLDQLLACALHILHDTTQQLGRSAEAPEEVRVEVELQAFGRRGTSLAAESMILRAQERMKLLLSIVSSAFCREDGACCKCSPELLHLHECLCRTHLLVDPASPQAWQHWVVFLRIGEQRDDPSVGEYWERLCTALMDRWSPQTLTERCDRLPSDLRLAVLIAAAYSCRQVCATPAGARVFLCLGKACALLIATHPSNLKAASRHLSTEELFGLAMFGTGCAWSVFGPVAARKECSPDSMMMSLLGWSLSQMLGTGDQCPSWRELLHALTHVELDSSFLSEESFYLFLHLAAAAALQPYVGTEQHCTEYSKHLCEAQEATYQHPTLLRWIFRAWQIPTIELLSHPSSNVSVLQAPHSLWCLVDVLSSLALEVADEREFQRENPFAAYPASSPNSLAGRVGLLLESARSAPDLPPGSALAVQALDALDLLCRTPCLPPAMLRELAPLVAAGNQHAPSQLELWVKLPQYLWQPSSVDVSIAVGRLVQTCRDYALAASQGQIPALFAELATTTSGPPGCLIVDWLFWLSTSPNASGMQEDALLSAFSYWVPAALREMQDMEPAQQQVLQYRLLHMLRVDKETKVSAIKSKLLGGEPYQISDLERACLAPFTNHQKLLQLVQEHAPNLMTERAALWPALGRELRTTLQVEVAQGSLVAQQILQDDLTLENETLMRS